MRQLVYTGLWFLTISIIVSLLLPQEPLGYLWILVILLSVFFGYNTGKKIVIPNDASKQMEVWIKKYQDLPYYQRQLFLSDLMERAILTNQIKEVEKFLNFIIDYEPDNDTIKGMLISLWGTSLVEKNQRAETI